MLKPVGGVKTPSGPAVPEEVTKAIPKIIDIATGINASIGELTANIKDLSSRIDTIYSVVIPILILEVIIIVLVLIEIRKRSS